MAQVIDTKRYRYERIRLRGPDGSTHYSASKIDAVSKSLVGMGTGDLIKVLQQNGLDHVAVHSKTKNAGHFRMIVSQALRAMLDKGSPVQIGTRLIRSRGEAVDWPEGWSVVPMARQGTPTPIAHKVD